MCGIAAIIKKTRPFPKEILDRFTDAVAHRGPDNRGIACFDLNLNRTENSQLFNVGLGHRRLSIIDLSASGNQPMAICNGDYIITYNGEIYNYLEIRAELEQNGFIFESHSDTEVLLAAYAKWGTACLERLNGMWSFVIIDKRKKILFVSRDRIGIKPLYYWISTEIIAFASEIKQFFQLPTFNKRINEESLLLYLATGYENSPQTFYKDISIFPPGHFAEIPVENQSFNPIKYWIPPEPQEKQDLNKLITSISNSFSKAVSLHMRSDVPVGVCLSGGIDSSSVLIIAGKLNETSPISAFSACSEEKKIDERPFMQKAINSGNFIHEKIFPNEKDFLNNFDAFIKQHDEPVGSLSMFAQYMVMKKAKEKGVSVLLDGQGADELLSGYWASYMLFLKNIAKKSPFLLIAHSASVLLENGNFIIFHEILRNLKEFKKRNSRSIRPFGLNNKGKELLDNNYFSKWHLEAQKLSPTQYRLMEIFKIHLPRLLKWEDRNSMAFSVESRLPFLDLEFMNLMLSVPPEMNMQKGWTKYLFRKAMNDILPKEICWRKDKIGFETPQEKWMKRGPLYAKLLDWTLEKEHPILEYAQVNFNHIRLNLQNETFDPNLKFRLFCADKWIKLQK